MIKLSFSNSLNRKIRQDDIKDLAIPTGELIKEAIVGRNTKRAIELLDYYNLEAKQMHDILAAFPDVGLTHIAKCCGEEEIINVFRERYYERAKEFIQKIESPEEALQRLVEQQRAHFSKFTVVEELVDLW